MSYTEDILYYARDPKFRGVIEGKCFSAHRENPSCGDALTFFLERQGDVLTKVRFDGVGCVICLAAAHVLSEHLEGKAEEFALAVTKENMIDWFGCSVGPMRENCMMLAAHCVKDALRAI